VSNPTKPVRLGIVGCGAVTREMHLPAFIQSPNVEVTYLCDRVTKNTQLAKQEYGLPDARVTAEVKDFAGHVDAALVAVPPKFHAPVTCELLAMGIDVLCEKPIALSTAEARQLRQLPPGIVFHEAFMVRHHPQWLRAREIARSGELGELRAIRGAFTYFLTDPTNVRNQADIGGGGIYDIGCYPVTASRFLFDTEPKRAVALVDRDPEMQTDRLASVLLDFGGGLQSSFVCSTQSVGSQRLELIGTKGRVEILIPFNAPEDKATAILVDKGYAPDGSLARREVFAPCDQYTLQADAFCRAVLGEKPLEWGVEDAIRHMKVLDAIFESEKTGSWAEVRG